MARTTLFGRYQTAEPSRSLGRMHLYGGAPLKEVDHEPKVGVLDQEGLFAQGIHVSQFIPNAVDVDALGSCTAQTSTEGLSNVLSQDEFFKTTGASSYDDVVAAQKFAITFYHLCTDQTGDPGQEWPPTDCGSSGPYIVKQMETMGLIDGDRVGNTAESLISLMQADGLCVGQPWFECLPDDQRVLTSDLRWVPIQKLEVGDELIGFDERLNQTPTDGKAKLRRSSVVALGTTHKPVYEISTAMGTVAASAGHLFVRSDRTKGYQWVRADTVKPGDKLAYFMPPFEEDRSWEAGWLSGFFDGEGSCNTTDSTSALSRGGSFQVAVSQNVGSTLELLKSLLAVKGYDSYTTWVAPAGRNGTNTKEKHQLAITGPYRGMLQFLGSIRPQRLIAQASGLWEGRSMRSPLSPPVEVLEVRNVGVEPVHTIGTSSRTLITEGFYSHNSWMTPDVHGFIDGGGSSDALQAAINSGLAGGHETYWSAVESLVLTETGLVDPFKTVLRARNSWSKSFADNGSYRFHLSTYLMLVAQCDFRQLVPLAAA